MANVFVTIRLLVTIALMWLIYLCPTVADTSCCADSNGCDESCPWNNACSFGKDYECMEDIGGYLSCQDRHGACQDYDSCSINEAARRAGILCGNKFPYYNGGYPIDSWKWQNVEEDQRCLKKAVNGSYCQTWEGHSNSNQYYEVSHSNCTLSDVTQRYCQQWSTKILMYRKCFSTFVSSDNGNKLTTICCHSGNHLKYDCCRNACPISTYNRRSVTTEYMNCYCDQTGVTNGTTIPYCRQWSCDRYTTTNQTYEEGRTTSTFQCVNTTTTTTSTATTTTTTATPISMANTVCTRWTGSSEEQKQFAVTSCTCSAMNVSSSSSSSSVNSTEGMGFCIQWSCHSKGTLYVIPNTLWVLFNAILGGFFWLVMMLVTERYRQRNRNIVSYTAHVALMHQHGDIVTREAPKMKASIVRAFVFPWLTVWFWCAPMTVIAVWKTGLMAFFTGFMPILLMTMGVMVYHSYWYHFYARQIPQKTESSSSSSTTRRSPLLISVTCQGQWLYQPLYHLYTYFNGSTPIFCCWDTVICCAPPAAPTSQATAATTVAMTTSSTMNANQRPTWSAASSTSTTGYILAPASTSAASEFTSTHRQLEATTVEDGAASSMHRRRGLGPVNCFCCTVDNIGMCLYRSTSMATDHHQHPNPIVEQPPPSTSATSTTQETVPPPPEPTAPPAATQQPPLVQQHHQPSPSQSQLASSSGSKQRKPKFTRHHSDPLDTVLTDTADMRFHIYDDSV